MTEFDDPRRLRVRWMIRRDLPAVLAIERTTVAPWSEDDFLRCLRQRHCIGFVAERGDEILGFMVYTLRPSHLQLENFAVRPDSRRLGVGSVLSQKLIARMTSNRRLWVSVVVREKNDAAVRFFRAMGFRAVGIAWARFDDTGEDGYRMEYRADPDAIDVADADGFEAALSRGNGGVA